MYANEQYASRSDGSEFPPLTSPVARILGLPGLDHGAVFPAFRVEGLVEILPRGRSACSRMKIVPRNYVSYCLHLSRVKESSLRHRKQKGWYCNKEDATL